MKNLLSLFICALVLIACSSDDNARVQSIEENPSLKVVATATITEDLNNLLGISDIITYTVTVKNIGDVNLSVISINNAFTDLDGNSISLTSGPNFVNADSGSSEGTLSIDETATYSATYTITQSEVNSGGLSISTTANGTSPEGEIVSDVSDNGNDLDGNDSNDPTVTIIEFDPLIISEYHQFNNLGEISNKYIFNDDGVFYKYSAIYANISVSFEYDSEGKITTIIKTDLLGNILSTHELAYDVDGRITNIDDHNYIYNTDEEYYYDEDSYFESNYDTGDLIYTEIGYSKYLTSESAVNYITRYCNYGYDAVYNTVTETYIDEYTYCNVLSDGVIGHDGINVTGHYNENDDLTYEHFSSINPLYTDSINLQLLYVFLKKINILNYSFDYKVIWSQNNLQSSTPGKEPSSIIWSYNYNDLDLPTDSTKQSYFGGGLEYEGLFANYYYQGDEIPE